MIFIHGRFAVVAIIALMACVVFTAPLAHADTLADNYTLGPDDVLNVVVYGEKDLSSNYKVGPGGTISVPLIGEVAVGGLTPRGVEKIITAKLADGYLVDPSVSIQVAEARPFYIMGEVKNPGSYKYVSNMTVLNAVAVAGGFTYRAREGKVDVTRGGENISVPVEGKIIPGDVITVNERFF